MMFKTYTSAAVFNPFAEIDEKYWSYAELSVNHMWILVRVVTTNEEHPCYTTLFLSKASQLADLDSRDDLKIIEVQVLTPAYKNEDNVWRMHQITKVSKGIQKYKSYKSPVIKYELIDGTLLFDSNLGRKVPKNTHFETIYSAVA